MSCACRTLPWSIFVQSLAQVHQLESTIARRAARLAPTIPSSRTHGWFSSSARQQQHGFHASAVFRRQVAAAAHAAEQTTQEHQTASSPEAESRPIASSQNLSSAAHSETLPAKTRPRRKVPVDLEEGRPQALPRESPSRMKNPEHRHKPKASTPGSINEDDRTPAVTLAAPKLEPWKVQKLALKKKFPEGWRPRKKLSPDALAGIRALNAQFPDVYTTEALADKFAMSVEAVRRILRSKWQPTPEQEQDRQERWFRRGMQVWEQKAALGIKPPKRWRMEGIARDPSHHERSKRAALREKEIEEREIAKYKAARPWLKFADRKGEKD